MSLKDITEKEWDFLCNLPKAEKERLDAEIIKAQEWRWSLLSVYELGELLNLGRNGVNALPIKFYYPRQKSTRGRRVVKSVHKNDLIEFLAGLNPTFADWCPDEGSLLTPEQVIRWCTEHDLPIDAERLETFRPDHRRPEYVQISSRTRRYRLKSVIDWLQDPKPKPLAASELFMQGIDHGDQ